MLPKPNKEEHEGNVIELTDKDFSWLQRNMKSVIATSALVIGMVTGNADRAYEYLSQILPPNTHTEQKLDELKQRIDKLEQTQCKCGDKINEVPKF